MTALTNEYLLYDEDCPLCEWYTKQFIRFHFVRSDERISFNRAIMEKRFDFDEVRAKNEIALVSDNGDVYYGVDSLLHIFGKKYRWIERIGHFLPIYLLLKLLYKLVSFNRKVIAPADCSKANSCEPTYHVVWRIVFILIAGLLTNVIVGNFFHAHFLSELRIDFPFMDFSLFLAQLLFQGVFFLLFKQRNFLNYAGQIAIISLIGALALGVMNLGITFLGNSGYSTEMLAPAALGIVIGIMFLEHVRRVGVLHHIKWLTVTWFVFRLIIYPIVFVV